MRGGAIARQAIASTRVSVNASCVLAKIFFNEAEEVVLMMMMKKKYDLAPNAIVFLNFLFGRLCRCFVVYWATGIQHSTLFLLLFK